MKTIVLTILFTLSILLCFANSPIQLFHSITNNTSYTSDSTETPLTHPNYNLYIKYDSLAKEQLWEHTSTPFFYDENKEGEQYLNAKAFLMGVDGTLGLRVEITINGDAFDIFGPISGYTPMVIHFDNRRTLIFYGYQYSSKYNIDTDETEYRVAFDVIIEKQRLLRKAKITQIDIGWIGGKGEYKVAQADALISQMADVKRAREDGIITKRRRDR